MTSATAENAMLAGTVSSKKQASEAKHSLTSFQLRFLAAASDGDLEELTCLLNRTGDVEQGTTSAASLLESVSTEGNTALHLVAAKAFRGNCEDCERCVKFIHEKDRSLLSKKNKNGDTPLHCAARAGTSHLVSYLIDLAKDNGCEVQTLLRMENNKNETALHEAVRRGDKEMVSYLLSEDPELAAFPTNGTSPLYLAIQLIDDTAILRKEDKQAREEGNDRHLKKNQEKSMAQTLHDEAKHGRISFLGPNGQNALHAAVLRGPVLTRKLLRWNMDLTMQRDGKGSTPLHFAAGLLGALARGSVCSQLLEANKGALYQVDNDGLYPIHVAASVGALQAISLFLKKCPGSAGLRDAKGRTFLHVAVENKQVWTVYRCVHSWPARITISHDCMNQSQRASIVNMQDNDGNTALHLAIKSRSLTMFSALCANRKVDLNITNAEGQTPRDIAAIMKPPGLFNNQNSQMLIRNALTRFGAWRGASRQDHFQKKYHDIYGLKSEHEVKELKKLRDLTEVRSITSVLIATVTFGVTFAMPGGYKADDHANGGTPTLGGRYAFDAFIMANTLAFIFSTAAVTCNVRGGSPTFNRQSRTVYMALTFTFMTLSVTCFTAAFALGLFAVLSPVAHKTAVAICAMSPLVVLCENVNYVLKWLLLAPAHWVRYGRRRTICRYVRLGVGMMFYEFWPFLLIFIWAAYGRTHLISKAQPPAV